MERLEIYDSASGKTRTVSLYDGISMDELTELLKAVFDRPIVGLADENEILYPLSVIANDPSLLATRERLTTVSTMMGAEYYTGRSGKTLQRQNGVADLNPAAAVYYPESDDFEEQEDDDSEELEYDEDFEAMRRRIKKYEEEEEFEAERQARALESPDSLTLKQSIEELGHLVGFGRVDVRTILDLLPSIGDRTDSASYHNLYREDSDDWTQELPLTVNREKFVELMNLFAFLVRDNTDENPDEELLHKIFDVLFYPSEVVGDGSIPDTRSDTQRISVPTLASGLHLLCSGDESVNLGVIFSLYCKHANTGRSVVPEQSASQHLSAIFRLVYQLCRPLRHSSTMAPEQFGHVYAKRELLSISMEDREYTDGTLSFREFDFVVKNAFRKGLSDLHERTSRGSESAYGYEQKAEIDEYENERREVKQLPAYEQDSDYGEVHPPAYHDSHHHESVLPGYHDSHAHETVLPMPVPPAVGMPGGGGGATPPQPPQEGHGGSPHMYIHDHSLYRSYLEPGPVGLDDSDHDRHFPEGELGKHYFHHYEVSSDESDVGVEDHHFPHAKHGRDFQFMDNGAARNFFRAAAETKLSARRAVPVVTDDDEEEDEGDDANALEDSLVAASLVEYDGGPIDVLKAQQILGFKAYQPDVILSSLLYAATDDGDVSLSSYHRLFDQLMRKRYSSLSVLQRSVADYIVSQIFDTFDGAGEGHIKMEELGWSLLIFCDGNPSVKARAATALMNSHVDTDLQGGLRAGDMIYCLLSVLKTVCALNKDFIAPMLPEQIAEELTICAFQHAGSNYLDDDSLDVEDAAQYWQEVNAGGGGSQVPSLIPVGDFEHWFGVVIAQFEFGESGLALPSDASLVSMGSASMGSGTEATSNAEEMSIPRLDSEPELNSYGALYSDASELRSSLESEASSARGSWKRSRYDLMINTDPDDEEEDDDEEDDGAYDESAQTSEDESNAAAVHPAEKFLNFADYPEFAGMDDSVTSGSRGDTSLGETSNSDVPSQSQSDYEETDSYPDGVNADGEGSTAVTLEMRSAARLLGLDGFPADDLMEVLGESSKNNELSLNRWLLSLSYIVQLAGGNELQIREARVLGERLFFAFSSDEEDYGDDADDAVAGITYTEFAAGLTVLCSGCTLEEKVMVAFTLMDADSDGLIDFKELCTLILAVLKVLCVSSPFGANKVRSLGVSLETMAVVVAKEAYHMFDLDPSEQVNMEIVADMCGDYTKLATGVIRN